MKGTVRTIRHRDCESTTGRLREDSLHLQARPAAMKRSHVCNMLGCTDIADYYPTSPPELDPKTSSMAMLKIAYIIYSIPYLFSALNQPDLYPIQTLLFSITQLTQYVY
jgi:hypothetical protein